MNYAERAKINVSEHIEKKGKFSYLSWVYGLDVLQKSDELSTWAYGEHTVYPDGTMMVTTTVSAFGKTIPMILPVMNNRNDAIKNPNAFDINRAYMRCLAKNIAAHGIGLYIFAGEDLPEDDDSRTAKDEGRPFDKTVYNNLERLQNCKTLKELKDVFDGIEGNAKYESIKDEMKAKLDK